MELVRQQTWLNLVLVAMAIASLVQSSLSVGSPGLWAGPINANPSYDVVGDPSNYKCPYRCDCFVNDLDTNVLWINCTFPSFGSNLRQLVDEDLHPQFTHTLIITCSYASIQASDRPKESDLWDAAFSKLKGLRHLTFDGCVLRKLERSSFIGLSNLQALAIRGADLNHVEMDIFGTLSSLTDLEISSSSIRYLPPLCSCTNLRKVNLTGNHLNSLDDSGVLCQGNALTSLEVLDVNRNFITYVPPWLAKTVPNLYRLGLADNYIDIVPEDAFQHFKRLHVLDITNNSMRSFESDLFSKSKDLIMLYLSGNDVRSITQDLLSPLYQLLQLDVANMGLDDGLWIEMMNLRNIAKLNVAHNMLTSVDDDVLSQFSDLEYLYANNNNILKIPKNSFAYQFKLKVLDLSYNKIQEVPKLVHESQNVLSELYLSFNSITSIDHEAFHGLKQLLTLDLAYNRVSFLYPKVLSDLVSLKRLDISGNRMVLIGNIVFDATTSLEYLNASRNLLTEFPRLSKATQLKVLDLSHNNLSSFKDHTFKDLSSLTYLNISYNALISVPIKLLSDCKSLEIIDLSHNEIKTLSDAVFSNLHNLRIVNISHNYILDINRVFVHTQKLVSLDISFNKLMQILRGNLPQSIQYLNLENNEINFISHLTFISMDQLRLVNLQHNRLKTLSKTDVATTLNMVYQPVFLIKHNPLICDCRLKWLKDWIDGRLQEIVALPNFKINPTSIDFQCTSPFSSSLKPFARIDRSRFLCNYTEYCDSASCICCGFDSCHCKFQCPSSCHCYKDDDSVPVHQVHCSNAHLTKVPQEIPEAATDLRLDGNNIPVLHKHTFLGLKEVRVLYMNNSQIETIQNSTFKGLKALKKLYMHNNLLSTIYDVTFEGLEQVEEIYLQNNDIFFIDSNAFLAPPLLTRIDLQGNALMTTSIQEFDMFINRSLSAQSRTAKLSLSRNPWNCDAGFSCTFLQFVLFNSDYIDDVKSIECSRPVLVDSPVPSTNSEARPLLDLQKDVCVDNTTVPHNATLVQSESEMYALITTCIIAAFIVILVVVAYSNRHLVQLFCFTRFGIRPFKMAKDSDDNERPYDAFISYSNKDEDFVVRQLAPRLEKGDKKFRLCVHYRDFPVGACIAETIVRSVEASKRTILVVSDNFLESEWCRFEFQTAHQQVLSERCNRVILVLMHNIDVNKLDNTLKAYMRTRTYLKYDDTWFWEKLMFAMPDIRNRKSNDSFRMARPPSNRDIDYSLTRDSRMGTINSHRSHPHSHQQAYPPFLHNGNYPHSCCDVMRNDMYEIPVSEGPSEHYQLAKIGAIFPHTNSAFHYTEKSIGGDTTTSGYHNGSVGGSTLPPHYEEVGPGQYSLNSTPQKKLLVETPPPLPRIPKDGFTPRDRMTFV